MKRVLIFGASTGAKKKYTFFKGLQAEEIVEIVAFIDNDSRKWNTMWEGEYQILSPDIINEIQWDYIVIWSVHKNEIIKQLMEKYDVSPQKIIDIFGLYLDVVKYTDNHGEFLSLKHYDIEKRVLLYLRETLEVSGKAFDKKRIECMALLRSVINMVSRQGNQQKELYNHLLSIEEIYSNILNKGFLARKELGVIMQEKLNGIVSKLEHHIPVHFLSIVVILKDEARHIREWVEYYRLLGVSHIYIYNNESQDGTEDILRSYAEEGFITLIDYPGKVVQVAAYNDAINKFKNETEYLAIIDSDEFIVPVDDCSLCDTVKDIFDSYYPMGALATNWRVYGCNYYINDTEYDLLTESHRLRASDATDDNTAIKTICNPRMVRKVLNPHYVSLKNGWLCLSENGSVVTSEYRPTYFPDGSCKKLRINHYTCRSKQEYMDKLTKRGFPNQPFLPPTEEESEYKYKQLSEKYNVTYDYVMEKYVPSLKAIVNNC